jgi:hypothetical protein
MNLIQPGKQMLNIGISGHDASAGSGDKREALALGMTARPFCCIAV